MTNVPGAASRSRNAYVLLPSAAVAVLTLLLTLGCNDEAGKAVDADNPSQGNIASQSNNGDASAAADVTLISGSQQDLAKIIAQNQGKVVLVDYWATWCGPCKEKFPHIVELHKELGDAGLVVISVSLDAPDAQEPVMEYLKSQNADMINLLSSKDMSEAFEDFDLGALPEYRVYGKQGTLQATFKTDPSAAKQYTVDDIKAKVKELLEVQ